MDPRFRPWVISSQLGRLMERSSLYWTDWPLIKLFILFWINLSNNKNVPVLGSSSPLVLVTIVIGIIWVTHEESGMEDEGGSFISVEHFYWHCSIDRAFCRKRGEMVQPTWTGWRWRTTRAHIIMFLNKSDPGAGLRLDWILCGPNKVLLVLNERRWGRTCNKKP